MLEEDIALANIALDLLGQSQALLRIAGELEGRGRSEDDLAYFRDVREFHNLQLVEQPNGDFAFTLARQFLFDSYSVALLEQLQHCTHLPLAGILSKALKEDSYHLRHSRQWVLRLGDGTAESHTRIQTAFDDLWGFGAELFSADADSALLQSKGVVPDLSGLATNWQEQVQATLKEATLTIPQPKGYLAAGSRSGMHTEHLGHLLSEMQSLARAFPGAAW